MRVFAISLVLLCGVRAFAQATKPVPWFREPSFATRTDERAVAAKAAIDRAAKLTPQQIDALVNQLVDGKLSQDDELVLEVLEDRATPALVAGLKDPRVMNYEPPVGEYPDSPTARIWQLLEASRPESAVGPLVALASAKNYQTRADAAFALGYIATDACIAPLQKAVADPETHVMEMAMNGVGHAMLRDDLPKGVRAKLFDVVAGAIDRKVDGLSNVGTTLVMIDRERAIKLLADPKRLTLEHPELASLLSALDYARAVLLAGQIATLCDALEPQLPEQSISYRYALNLLARTGDPSMTARVDRAMRSPDKELRADAPHALLVLNGVEDAYPVAFAKWESAGTLDKLSEPVRAYVAVNLLNSQVINGGFNQFFTNSAGDYWQEARWGLEQVDAKKSHIILVEVLSFFGPDGPKGEQGDRVLAMSEWSADKTKRLAELEKQYYADSPTLNRKLAEWVIAHKDQFVSTPTTAPSIEK